MTFFPPPPLLEEMGTETPAMSSPSAAVSPRDSASRRRSSSALSSGRSVACTSLPSSSETVLPSEAVMANESPTGAAPCTGEGESGAQARERAGRGGVGRGEDVVGREGWRREGSLGRLIRKADWGGD